MSTELVKLSVSPHIAAECGKAVALNCNVSSSRNELSIKRMQWLLNKKSLCSVDSDRNMRTDNGHATSGFHCEYSHGQLSLIFENMQPVDSGSSNSYMCKLQSNQGVEHASTTVELEGQSPHLFLMTAIINVQNTKRLVYSSLVYLQLWWWHKYSDSLLSSALWSFLLKDTRRSVHIQCCSAEHRVRCIIKRGKQGLLVL